MIGEGVHGDGSGEHGEGEHGGVEYGMEWECGEHREEEGKMVWAADADEDMRTWDNTCGS